MSLSVSQAEAEREAAHARLQSTLALLKERTAPANVARRVTEDAKAKAARTGRQAMQGVQDNPGAVAAGVATLFAAGALLFTRKRRKAAQTAAEAVKPDLLTASINGLGEAGRITQDLKERTP